VPRRTVEGTGEGGGRDAEQWTKPRDAWAGWPFGFWCLLIRPMSEVTHNSEKVGRDWTCDQFASGPACS
jgi:hypothetical protein